MPEPTQVEYIEQLLDDFDLQPSDKIADLIQALEDEEEDEEVKEGD